MKPKPITQYVMTSHARWELTRRGLSEDSIHAILAAPEQAFEVQPGRLVLQSRTSLGQPPKLFLLRVFVDVDRTPAEVVTVMSPARWLNTGRRRYESLLR